MKIVRHVTVERPVSEVFDYLSDFTTTMEWDPATVLTERQSGAGGVGTRYRNVSRFLGREAELAYEVTDLVPNQRFALRGENRTLVAHDVMTFSGDDERSTLTYEATFRLKGLARLAAPFLAPAFTRLGDGAEAGLRDALGRLAGRGPRPA